MSHQEIGSLGVALNQPVANYIISHHNVVWKADGFQAKALHMGKRPTVADLARAAGVSVATVDRVLNQRHSVRVGTANLVLSAAEKIGYHATPLLKQRLRLDAPPRIFGFLLQKRDSFYSLLADDLQTATRNLTKVRGEAIVEFVTEISPSAICQRLRQLGERVDAIACVSVDHPHVSQEIETLQTKGVPTFAILSDLTAPARAGFIGRDNRKEGRTAAWVIAKTAARPGKVGIIVGSHRYLCQETAEISFRAWFREHAPQFQVLEPLTNLEDARLAQNAAQKMISAIPDLVGLYICGGGMEGVIAAARDASDHAPIAIVCNERTPKTKAGLTDGVLTAVIATPTATLAMKTVEAMAGSMETPANRSPDQILVPFELCIATNI